MPSHRLAGVAALALTLASALPASAATTATTASSYYQIDRLGFLGGGNFLVGVAMNSSGDIAGYATDADGVIHAFRWTAAGGLEDLGLNGGTGSMASAMNEHGDIVGTYWSQDGVGHPFIAPRGGVMTDLLPQYPQVLQLTGISNNGRLTGYTSEFHAFRTDLDGTLHELTTTLSAAFAINDAGTVAGSVWPDGSMAVPGHAFRYSDAEGFVDLGTVRGGASVARAVNGAGVVVGWSGGTDTIPVQAFRAAPGLAMVDLGVLPSGTLGGVSDAYAVNDSGDVVGQADSASGMTAFLYTDTAGLVDLRAGIAPTDRDQVLLDAGTAINRNRQIVATFFDPTGTMYSTVRLTPAARQLQGPVAAPTVDIPYLRPPNNRMVTVRVDPHVTDDYDPAPRCAIFDVVNSGRTHPGPDPDVDVIGPLTVKLRATRSGAGGDRTYTIRLRCSDRVGLSTTAHVAVVVPHDNRHDGDRDRDDW